MKSRTPLFAALVLSVFVPAIAARAADSSSQAQSSSSNAAAQADSPKKACELLAQAAQKGDYTTARTLMMKPMRGAGPEGGRRMHKRDMDGAHMKQRFEEMRNEHMDQLKDLKCSSEQTAGNHAIVTAETQGDKRLIPFVKEGSSWKFDPHTYMSFYHEDIMKYEDMKKSQPEKKQQG